MEMPRSDTPWVGLAALAAMFVIPFLPSWLFEGPRTIRHRSPRHVCADCGAQWIAGHACELEVSSGIRPLRGEIERIGPSKALPSRRPSTSEIGNS
jgi:hypothetical protein